MNQLFSLQERWGGGVGIGEQRSRVTPDNDNTDLYMSLFLVCDQ